MEVDQNGDQNGVEMMDVNNIKIEKVEEQKPVASVAGNPVVPDDDPEDPVVHEIPVFLAKTLAKKLYLLQVISSRNLCNLSLYKSELYYLSFTQPLSITMLLYLISLCSNNATYSLHSSRNLSLY